MSDKDSEVRFVAVIAITIVVIILIANLNGIRKAEIVQEMVKNGSSPVEARCAIYGGPCK